MGSDKHTERQTEQDTRLIIGHLSRLVWAFHGVQERWCLSNINNMVSN